jgi:hypothetical protein
MPSNMLSLCSLLVGNILHDITLFPFLSDFDTVGQRNNLVSNAINRFYRYAAEPSCLLTPIDCI